MTVKSNNQVILEKIIQEKKSELGRNYSDSEYFEVYSAAQVLKDKDLNYDDIAYGIVGNGGDGGIDSMYLFLNGELIKEDTHINGNQKILNIELVVIQSKTTKGFGEDAVMKFRESAQDLFNLSNEINEFKCRYNRALIDNARLFKQVYSSLAAKFPKMTIKYFYITLGEEVHVNVEGKVPKLREDILRMFNGAEFHFNFVTATKLLEITRDIPTSTRVLEVAESPIGTSDGSYVCLVGLSRYFEFISDNGSLARSIFESNVRDYQGDVAVNNGIKATLANINSENFWYLNNGVTIITPRAVLSGKKLTIEDPQIVNGLQTSHEVFEHFSNNGGIQDDRMILVRVINADSDDSRDRIIRATNSQTSIPPASLRSSDNIHRNIEDYLKSNDYYYDRKKNHYKNLGKPASRVISIPFLAQAMMSTILLRPNDARARPSTLINSDDEYRKIFSMDYPIDVYYKAISLLKIVEGYIREYIGGIELDRKTITNIKFYLLMVYTIKLCKTKAADEMIQKIISIGGSLEQESFLKDSIDLVLREYNSLGATDQIAKGIVLRDKLLDVI